MILFPNSHQFLYRKNKSHLHSLWLTLYLGTYLLFVNVLFGGILKPSFFCVTGILLNLWSITTGYFKFLWYGIIGYLDTEDMTVAEFIMTHIKTHAESAARRQERK